jgi:SAM-dependent methyltransferase
LPQRRPAGSAANAHYWNARADPLDWKRASGSGTSRRWLLAHATFLVPDARDAIEFLEPLEDRRVLDLGCAQGYGTAHLTARGARAIGVDLSTRRCEAATRSVGSRAAFCVGRAERLPFADASFDRILCRDVLMYADPGSVLRECARVLRPGGRAAFGEALAGHVVLRAFRRWTSPVDYRRFTRHLGWCELRRLPHGLRVVRIRAHYLLSQVAFFALFVLRSPRLHAIGLRALEPFDRVLLDCRPRLARAAWRASLFCEKPGDGA